MAKSFRQGDTGKAPIDSKKDILDFLEEEHAQSEERRSKPKSAKKKAQPKPEFDLPEEVPVVRQTFIIGRDYLDKLKDLVYTKRVSGQFDYSQKDALQDGLDMLFASTKIKKRPLEVRQKEEARSRRIRAGRHSRL